MDSYLSWDARADEKKRISPVDAAANESGCRATIRFVVK
jgi:hypothetical protein